MKATAGGVMPSPFDRHPALPSVAEETAAEAAVAAVGIDCCRMSSCEDPNAVAAGALQQER